jgi:hypothetical protein
MLSQPRLRHLHADDPALVWMMRVIGLLLATASVYFLGRDLRLGTADDWFLTASALLGLVTFGSTLLPARRKLVSHRLAQRDRIHAMTAASPGAER